jgi:hypothetical protein
MAKTTCINYALDLMEGHEYYRIENIVADAKDQNKVTDISDFLFYKYNLEHNLYIFKDEAEIIEFVNTNFLEDEE